MPVKAYNYCTAHFFIATSTSKCYPLPSHAGTRDSQAVMLLPSPTSSPPTAAPATGPSGAPAATAAVTDDDVTLRPGWVVHREGGVLYGLDVTRCMFSSGNTTERQRIGRGVGAGPGEVVVDLYAGIGYYTLPLLVVAKVDKVGVFVGWWWRWWGWGCEAVVWWGVMCARPHARLCAVPAVIAATFTIVMSKLAGRQPSRLVSLSLSLSTGT